MAFIDESGTTSPTDSMFATAAVWCVPTTREGYQGVLKPTARSVWETIQGYTQKKVSEIHYTAGLKRYANDLLPVMTASCYSDSTIVRTGIPWNAPPVAYTTCAINPMIESRITRRKDLHCDIRSRAIASLLRPLFHYQGELGFDVSIILDDTVWQQAVDHCGGHIKDVLRGNGIDVSLSCVKSTSALGLQLADLVVGVTKDYYLNGINHSAFSVIDRNTIDHIGRGALDGVNPLD